jgi:DNA invertase Pin-like site-specific DNA recombinase
VTVRAAIYTRISNDSEGRELGVARQEKDCRALAEREGLEVVEVYSDNDISAAPSSRKPRPSYLRMLDDAEAGRFDVVVAYSTSRLTRRPREIEDFIELHQDVGTRLLTVASGAPDLSTADGRMHLRLLSGVDSGEAERGAERARRKQQELAEAGRHIGPRPFGWNIDGRGPDQRLTINEAEAAILRECVQRVLAGEGLWKIVNDLNTRGIPTSTGKPWVTQVLRRVLLRDRNYGVRKHQPLGKDGKPKGRPMFYSGAWEPIIDKETHDRVVAHLTDPARKTNNRGTAPKYLLTSVAYCGECGGYVVGTKEFTYTVQGYKRKDGTRSPSKQRVYAASYKCPRAGCMKVQRRMADVDEHVSRVVVALLERDGVRLLGGDPVAADAARKRIAELEAKMALAADKFIAGEWTDEMVSRITTQAKPQIEVERDNLRRAQPADASLVEFTGPGIAEAWAKADVETKKAIIRLLGMRITVHPVGPGNGGEYDPASVTITPERA